MIICIHIIYIYIYIVAPLGARHSAIAHPSLLRLSSGPQLAQDQIAIRNLDRSDSCGDPLVI